MGFSDWVTSLIQFDLQILSHLDDISHKPGYQYAFISESCQENQYIGNCISLMHCSKNRAVKPTERLNTHGRHVER